MLALLGILSELELPILAFDNAGTTTYEASTDSFEVSATPTLFINPPNPTDILDFTGTLDINIEVDSAGQVNLLAGTTTDLVVTGNIDVDGDTVDDYTGTLLTGQIVGFGSENAASGTTDLYDFRFVVTGGALATDFFTGKDIGVVVTSELSTFNDDFTVDYAGEAKGNLGPVPSDQQVGTSSIHGVVWEDFNDDGEINFSESVIEGVTVQLLDENGQVIDETQTDDQGLYWFMNLDAGTYGVMELQPNGYVDGQDIVGEVDGQEVGDNSVNDKITGIVLPADTAGVNYNFGERPEEGGEVAHGMTATIGFWQNKNGQALLKSVNEGLGDWLAATMPNVFGNDGDGDVNPLDMTGKTNAEVAEFYKQEIFRVKKKDAPPGPPKVDAQVMGAAFAVYATNSTLAGSAASSYGFTVTSSGVGTATINVGDNGAAFGVADYTEITVLDALIAADSYSQEGLLYDDFDQDSSGDGLIDSVERALRVAANEVFSMINENGDI